MLITAVESTALATVGYDEGQELLQLEFCDQAMYRYFGVPASVHQALLDAPSKGKYFNQAIRERFAFWRISGWNADVAYAPKPTGRGR